MERVYTGAAMPLPQVQVPATARRRRRRNRRMVRLPLASLRRFILSSRWVSLLLVALCIAALVLIGLEEDFFITLVPVEGVASIPPSEIVQASGLGGTHIFAAEPQVAAMRVDEMPGVISATVSLEWPNHATISIREDSPVAVWEQAGQTYWVNKHGELVPARIDIPGILHIIAEMPGAAAVAALAGESAAAEGREAAEEDSGPLLFVPEPVLAGALLLRELRPNIEALYYDPGAGLSYQDGRGWRAYFGTGTDMAQKLVVYETLVDDLLAERITPQYVSVQNQEKPFYLGR
ncbi:MAG: FtsQ-type POTRA domain-containing protein [Anaerolineae bacterium]|nr:FtsQ-type POTRA domain-containing protein [Anaerolineae bacterium]